MSEKTYSIGDTAEITGISQRMLRAWEGKHIPYPERIQCGKRSHRRYSQAQINLIQRIRKYLEQGYTLKTAAQKAALDLASEGGVNRI